MSTLLRRGPSQLSSCSQQGSKRFQLITVKNITISEPQTRFVPAVSRVQCLCQSWYSFATMTGCDHLSVPVDLFFALSRLSSGLDPEIIWAHFPQLNESLTRKSEHPFESESQKKHFHCSKISSCHPLSRWKRKVCNYLYLSRSKM